MPESGQALNVPNALVALLPVLAFLALLLFLDSYKLVRPWRVLAVLGAGVVAAGCAYAASRLALGPLGLALDSYSRWLAPWVEEALKGAVIVWLASRHRIGFLVDAAICGFAVGSGFALVENLAYLRLAGGAELGTWIVRGFGTAVMHGGATALLAVMALAVLDRQPQAYGRAFVPALAAAAAVHMAFNLTTGVFGAFGPQAATLGTLLLVPALLLAVFHFSERQLAQWLGSGFDADARMLELLHSGEFGRSPAGLYLGSLKASLGGMLLVDALAYLRLYTELSLRAKGLLMLREHELPTPPPDATLRAQLDELRHLEQALGASGRRALKPLLHMKRRELWQLNLLESE